MNLKTIVITPFAQGIIKVDCEAGDEPGTIQTRPGMVVCARHHETSEPGNAVPALAKHPIQDRLMEREANREANLRFSFSGMRPLWRAITNSLPPGA